MDDVAPTDELVVVELGPVDVTSTVLTRPVLESIDVAIVLVGPVISVTKTK